MIARSSTALNTTVGFPVPHSQTAKPSMFGRKGRLQPLGSFFPLDFLTPPIVGLRLMCLMFFFLHMIFYCTAIPLIFSRDSEGVNLRITYVPCTRLLTRHDHVLTCLLYCLVMEAKLNFFFFHHCPHNSHFSL